MMKLFHLYEYQFLIYLDKKYSWREFREKAKVAPGTYGETFAKNIYLTVFENSIHLNEDYKKYYKDEYDDYYQFLFWRHGISEEIIDQLPTTIDQGYLAIFTYYHLINEEEIFWESLNAQFRALEE